MILSKRLKDLVLILCTLILLTSNAGNATALIDAVKSGNLNRVEALLKSGVNVNEQDRKGATALIHAAINKEEITKLLLRSNPNLNIQDQQGLTALMYAVLTNNKEIVELLLERKPNLNQQDHDGMTALMYAAKYNYKEIFNILYSASQFTIPQKTLYLSFEQEDVVGAVADGLLYAIIMKVPAIISPALLSQLFFTFHPFIAEYFEKGKFTVLANETIDIVVIIPESLTSLNITIPKSLRQKDLIYESLLESIVRIEEKYGLKNLHLINPKSVTKVIKAFGTKKFTTSRTGDPLALYQASKFETFRLIENFTAVIDIYNANHQTRFYLDGHGAAGKFPFVASIPITLLNNFFDFLSMIGAVFLYINSCYTAGTNLRYMQTILGKIITNRIATNESFKNGINYAIVIQTTSGIPTSGTGNINAMFTKLDEFLKNPEWTLEFGPGVLRPSITISDVISSLGIKSSVALPSIRLPGKTEFFRSINIGNMEIITISKLTEARVTKTLQLIAQSKSKDKTIADEAKRKLTEPLAIKFTIKPYIRFIQIFPIDLTDFIFVVEGPFIPNFISKLTGTGQHFIGGIMGKSSLQNLIDGFVTIFKTKGEAETSLCWFIKSVDLSTASSVQHFKKLVVKLDPATAGQQKAYIGSFAYINEKGEFMISIADKLESKDKETYESTVRSWFESTIPSQETLTEATGGVEVTAVEKARLEKAKTGTVALRLLEPQFVRTPQDLFNMFMAD